MKQMQDCYSLAYVLEDRWGFLVPFVWLMGATYLVRPTSMRATAAEAGTDSSLAHAEHPDSLSELESGRGRGASTAEAKVMSDQWRVEEVFWARLCLKAWGVVRRPLLYPVPLELGSGLRWVAER